MVEGLRPTAPPLAFELPTHWDPMQHDHWNRLQLALLYRSVHTIRRMQADALLEEEVAADSASDDASTFARSSCDRER